MLILYGGEQVFVVSVAQELESFGAHRFCYAVKQVCRHLRAVSFFKHIARVLHAAVRNDFLRKAKLVKVVEDISRFVSRQMRKLRDFIRQLLDLVLTEVFVNFRSGVAAEGYNNRGSLLGGCDSSIACRCHHLPSTSF